MSSLEWSLSPTDFAGAGGHRWNLDNNNNNTDYKYTLMAAAADQGLPEALHR
jgi:hypothetical protein